MLSIRSITWIENICYCCSQIGQTIDGVSNITVSDIGMELTVSVGASRNLQPLVFDGDITVKTALLESGTRPFSLSCLPPWGGLCDVSTAEIGANLVNDILIETRVQLVADRLIAPRWLLPVRARRELRHTTR